MNYSVIKDNIKSLILFVFAFSAFTSNAQYSASMTYPDSLIIESKEYAFYHCSRSNVPVFNMPVNSILELEIKTDFQKIFETKRADQKRIEGTITYTLNGNKVELPIKIRGRGRTRFAFCKYKPLDIKFPSSVKSTIFEGLEKFHLTTHCGNTDYNQWIFIGTNEDHRNRLLAEYYMYSILETLETTTSSVSLCRVKYVNNEDSILTEELAFIVEPYDNVGERCGLIKNKKEVHYLDESSLLNADLINYFITNYDWHYEYIDTTGWIGKNVKFLKSKDKIGYFLPYDFDLTVIAFPDYWKNESESFDEHCSLFQEMLTNYFSDKKKLEAPYKILTNIPTIKTMIEDSHLDSAYKKKFIYWLDSYEFILITHLSQYNKYKRKLN